MRLKATKHKDGGYTYFSKKHPELRKFERDLWIESHDAGFLPEIELVVPFKKVLEIFARDVLPLLPQTVAKRQS